jgi:SAM-dependent methyltransferase
VLRETLLDDGDFEPWVSSHSIDAGQPWFEEIEKAAEECEAALGCITPGAGQRPWVNFEAGLLFAKLRNFKPLRFNEELKWPLAMLQSLDGTSRADMKRLLESLLTKPQRAEAVVERAWKRWEEVITEVFANYPREQEIRTSAEALREEVLGFSRNPHLASNECLHLIVQLSLGKLEQTLSDVGDAYKAPQMDYPYHLFHLQRHHKARVRAIALLQEEEQFWQRGLGDRLADSAQHDSTRLFIVRNERQLEEHWKTLLRHSKAYRVYVLSRDELTRRFENKFVRDFSIIEINGASVFAAYDVARDGYIEYTSNPSLIAEAATVYSDMIQRAQYLDPKENLDLDTVKAEVFADRALTTLSKRPVEMSVYVPLDDYDSHEEEHAYYVEMMQAMVDAFRGRCPEGAGSYRVLEFGAGTGIFTRRLAATPNISEVMALEIDWACYSKLAYNLRDAAAVKPLNEDSRHFSPTGRFHAVFSSFADHHIKPQDKRDYLRNVRRNLHENGTFIVGDEFLPPHAAGDRTARLKALAAYHGHIIEIARSKGQDVLVKLETAAWESGKNEVGDFKVTCAEYETFLREGGFTFQRQRIGPGTDDVAKEVGGVYVYVAVPATPGVTDQRW